MFDSTLDAARKYAAAGWPIFPCGLHKKPLTQHGFKDATTDFATIADWLAKWPDAQLAVDCGRAKLCVIDLDMGNGKDGVALFTQLAGTNPHWCGLIASTPRGGRHLVYRMPDPPMGNAQNACGHPGIDVRADGGYIVLPSHSSPGREWVEGDFADPDSYVQMPPWVEEIARDGKRPHTASNQPVGGASGAVIPLAAEQVAAIKHALTFIDADHRATWIRVGMALKSTSAGNQAFALWTEWSQTSPRWPTFDFAKHVAQWQSLREFFMDGREITLGSLFHMAKEAGYVPSIEEEVASTAAPAPAPAEKPTPKRPFNHALVKVPGLVGAVAEWMIASSTRQQPAMCLASAIAMLGSVIGRRVATPTDLRSNVYCLGIGETACGKDPGVRLPQLLLKRAGLRHRTGPGEWKSDSGLRAALVDELSHTAFCDEFTKVLASMTGQHAPTHLVNIKKYLLELWAASNSVHLSAAYADRKMNAPITLEQPNLCLYGTGVPNDLFTSIDRGALTDGFINRFLIFFADEQMPKRQKVAKAEPPQDLVDRLRALDEATKLGDLEMLTDAVPVPRVVPLTPDAEALLTKIEDENDERIKAMRDSGNACSDLWVRYGAQIAKVALIRTVCDEPTRPIALADVEWARDLVLWCVERTMAEAEDRVSDSEHEARTKKVLRILTAVGPNGMSAAELSRKTQWLRRGDRVDVFKTLEESGDMVKRVVEVEREKRGKVLVTTYIASKFVEE